MWFSFYTGSTAAAAASSTTRIINLNQVVVVRDDFLFIAKKVR